jgi:hypothetical protein
LSIQEKFKTRKQPDSPVGAAWHSFSGGFEEFFSLANIFNLLFFYELQVIFRAHFALVSR